MNRRARSSRVLVTLLALLALIAGSAIACDDVVSIHCGSTPTAALTDDGALLAVFVANDHVYFTRGDPEQVRFLPPVRISRTAARIDNNGESRPKIALGLNGTIYVSWTRRLEARFSGDVYFSRSVDGGQTFESPRVLRDTPAASSHRFDVLQVTPSGRLYAAWIDKRDIEAAEAAGEAFTGASVYYAYSDDRGETFSTNQRVAAHSCECCRLAVVPSGDDQIHLLWRHVFDGHIRDHALTTVGPSRAAPLMRASHEDWTLQGCPHEGPHMAADGKGLHMVWFSGAPDAGGIHYGYRDLDTDETTHLQHIDNRPVARKPQVAVRGERVDLVWLAVEAEQTALLHQYSIDAGRTWLSQQTLTRSAADTDSPQLLQGGDMLWVAWHAQDEGYQLLALPGTTTKQP